MPHLIVEREKREYNRAKQHNTSACVAHGFLTLPPDTKGKSYNVYAN